VICISAANRGAISFRWQERAFDAQADPAVAWAESQRTERRMNFSARPGTRSRRIVADRPASQYRIFTAKRARR